MITETEALAAIDPKLPDDQRKEHAARLIASSAALDAYLDSRAPLEQIIERARGAGQIHTFQQLNPDGGAKVPVGGAVDATAVEDHAPVNTQVGAGESITEADVVQPDPEIVALEKRLAELRAAGK